jgi:hypothetical protein
MMRWREAAVLREEFGVSTLLTGRDGKMTTSGAAKAGFPVNKQLVMGAAVLLSIASLLGLAGALLGSSAMLSAVRQWVNQQDRPPADMAKLKLQQFRSAVSAGSQAWASPQSASSSR